MAADRYVDLFVISNNFHSTAAKITKLYLLSLEFDM